MPSRTRTRGDARPTVAPRPGLRSGAEVGVGPKPGPAPSSVAQMAQLLESEEAVDDAIDRQDASAEPEPDAQEYFELDDAGLADRVIDSDQSVAFDVELTALPRLRDLPLKARPRVLFWIDGEYHVHPLIRNPNGESLKKALQFTRAIAHHIKEESGTATHPRNFERTFPEPISLEKLRLILLKTIEESTDVDKVLAWISGQRRSGEILRSFRVKLPTGDVATPDRFVSIDRALGKERKGTPPILFRIDENHEVHVLAAVRWGYLEKAEAIVRAIALHLQSKPPARLTFPGDWVMIPVIQSLDHLRSLLEQTMEDPGRATDIIYWIGKRTGMLRSFAFHLPNGDTVTAQALLSPALETDVLFEIDDAMEVRPFRRATTAEKHKKFELLLRALVLHLKLCGYARALRLDSEIIEHPGPWSGVLDRRHLFSAAPAH